MQKNRFKKDYRHSWEKKSSNTVKHKDIVYSSENTKPADFWKDLSGEVSLGHYTECIHCIFFFFFSKMEYWTR